MCTRDSSLKESNYDGARHFDPDRWFNHDTTDYHAFASVPFGFGARKCLGQNIAETMLSVLTMKVNITDFLSVEKNCDSAKYLSSHLLLYNF